MREGTPVMVVQTTHASAGVFMPQGARIITPRLLGKLLDAVDAFLAALASRPANGWTEKEIMNLLTQQGLAAAQIVGTFTTAVE